MLFEEEKKNYARRLLLCLFSCLLLECACATGPIAQQGVIQQVTQTQSIDESSALTAVVRSLRGPPPSTYALDVISYSKLVTTQTEKYESDVFEASGYKWTLVLYPTGNSKDNGANHISLYLSVYNPSSLPQNWEINAEIKFFVYNKPRNQYLTVQDSDIQRFDATKTERGIGQLIQLTTFNNANNGYLVNDNCRFGVEIFVVKPYQRSESLTFYEKPAGGIFGWRILQFSGLDKSKFVYSDEFTVAKTAWKLRVAPGGDGDGWQTHLSIYLELSDASNFRVNEKVYGRAKVRVLSTDSSKTIEKQLGKWFTKDVSSWGFQKFMPLGDLKDASKGYLENDRLNIEVEFELVSKTEYVP